jgi:DNA-binding XRE family transcriptional regulator
MRFASVGYLARQKMIAVTFENGDHFLVAVESILPTLANGSSARSRSQHHLESMKPNWTKMLVSETGDVIEVPTNSDAIEIPWDRIRAIADPDFRAHLADRAAERARRIGARVRTMRLETGMTRVAIAESVGVTREMFVEFESGKIDPNPQLIQAIAVALGKQLRDFSEEVFDRPVRSRPASRR